VIDILDNGSSRAAFIHDAKATGNDDKIKQALRIVDLSIKVRGADLFEFQKTPASRAHWEGKTRVTGVKLSPV
jgi:hypothetical protein